MAVAFSFRQSNSFVHKTKPLVKLILLIILSFIPWQVSLPLTIIIAIIIKLPLFSYYKQLIFFVIIAALIYYSNGLNNCLNFIGILIASLIFTDSTAPEDLAQALSPILGKSFSLYISLTLAMLSKVILTLNEARLICKARGRRFAILLYLTSTINLLLNQSQEYELALKNRIENN